MLSDIKYGLSSAATANEMKPMGSGGVEENRHFLRAFIQTYRDLPVLWDTSLRDYTNRERRAEAYEQLVPIYRYLKRDATVEDVKKKINTLRTNYRKELKVVECARRAGTVHQPRCWTFHELDFLRNTEKFLAVHPNARSNTSVNTNDSFSFNDNSQASFMDAPGYGFRGNSMSQQHNGMPPQPPSITELFQKSFGQPQPQKLEPQPTPPPPPLPPLQLQTTPHLSDYGSTQTSIGDTTAKRKATHPPEELLHIACDYLATTFPEEESIARTWTYKLKRMQREQRLLAEKFINEILFEAESGTLHRGSVQINSFEPYVRLEEEPRQPGDEHAKSQSPSVHTSTSNTASLQHDSEAPKEISVSEGGNGVVSNGAESSFPNYN